MGMRAVVMADDISMQELLELILTKRGLKVLPMESAGLPPLADLLVLDSHSLLASGPERLRGLLQKWSVSASNVVLFADIRSPELEEVEQLGCRVITKPFRLGTIFDWLDECEQRVQRRQGLH